MRLGQAWLDLIDFPINRHETYHPAPSGSKERKKRCPTRLPCLDLISGGESTRLAVPVVDIVISIYLTVLLRRDRGMDVDEAPRMRLRFKKHSLSSPLPMHDVHIICTSSPSAMDIRIRGSSLPSFDGLSFSLTCASHLSTPCLCSSIKYTRRLKLDRGIQDQCNWHQISYLVHVVFPVLLCYYAFYFTVELIEPNGMVRWNVSVTYYVWSFSLFDPGAGIPGLFSSKITLDLLHHNGV